MTTTREHPPVATGADLDRWPAMAPPRPAPVRAAIARVLLTRIARHAGVAVTLPDGTRFGPRGGPVLAIR
ncbi:MAG: hypothetical protein QOG34_1120, partial [Frankiaceae bacterium]|nr:hypothetical protein [Frankiaceae bacterium]